MSRRRLKLRRVRRRSPPGAPPGTLIADPQAGPSRVRVVGYGPDRTESADIDRAAQLEEWIGAWPVLWVDVEGLADVDLIQGIARLFRLHDLALEDVINTHQRAKVEDYVDHLFLVTRAIGNGELAATEQVTLFLGRDFILTFHETGGWNLDRVRERLARNQSVIRRAGPDHLAYAVLDMVVDGYFPLLEALGESIEALEEHAVADDDPQIVGRVHSIKHELLLLRRAVWPQREMLNALIRDRFEYIGEPVRVYLRDCYDHCVQLMDTIETYRDVASGLMELHLASVSNRMNETMKVLTVIATIFIPLSVITGIYGMNFDTGISPWNQPELHWYLGYPFALGLMLAVAVVMLWYFRRKGWIGRSRRPPPAG